MLTGNKLMCEEVVLSMRKCMSVLMILIVILNKNYQKLVSEKQLTGERRPMHYSKLSLSLVVKKSCMRKKCEEIC